jgi:putative transcriptional regulator
MQILLDDRNGRSTLLRMQAGGRLPAHDHPGDEECLVLEGSCFLGELRMHRGDYQHAGQGTRHGEVTSPDGCLLFIRSVKTKRNVETRLAGMP